MGKQRVCDFERDPGKEYCEESLDISVLIRFLVRNRSRHTDPFELLESHMARAFHLQSISEDAIGQIVQTWE